MTVELSFQKEVVPLVLERLLGELLQALLFCLLLLQLALHGGVAVNLKNTSLMSLVCIY